MKSFKVKFTLLLLMFLGWSGFAQTECPEVGAKIAVFCFVDENYPTVADLATSVLVSVPLEGELAWYSSNFDTYPLSYDTVLTPDTAYYVGLSDGSCRGKRSSVTVRTDGSYNAGPDNLTEELCYSSIRNISYGQFEYMFLEMLGDGVDRTGTFNPSIEELYQRHNDIDIWTSAGYSTTYTLGSGDCSDSAELKLTVYQTVNAGSNGSLSISSAAAPVDLFDYLEGYPDAGGEWSGLEDGIFDPATDAAGTYVYRVTNGVCKDAASVTVQVESPVCPTVLQSEQHFCGWNYPEYAKIKLLEATDNGGGVAWYIDNNSTTPLDPETLIMDGRTYYAGNLEASCAGNREAVTAILEDFPVAGSGTHLEFASNAAPVDLVTHINDTPVGPPDEGGSMIPALKSGSTYFDPALEANWTGEKRIKHFVKSQNEYCEDDETFIWINIVPQENTSHHLIALGDTKEEAKVNFPPEATDEKVNANIWIDNSLKVGEVYYINGGGLQGYFYVINVDQAPNYSPDITLTSDTEFTQTSLVPETCPTITETVQGFCIENDPAVADLIPTDVLWYSSNDPGISPLSPSTPLTDGMVYYAGDIDKTCTSRPQVSVNLTQRPDAGSPALSEECDADTDIIFPDYPSITKYLKNMLDAGVSRDGTFSPTSRQLSDQYQATNINGYADFTTTYTISENGCQDSVDLTIRIHEVANAGVDVTVTLYTDDAPVDLKNYLGDNVSNGGGWSVLGDGIFDPAIDSSGDYTYTVDGCTGEDSAIVSVTVVSKNCPIVTESEQHFCKWNYPEYAKIKLLRAEDNGGGVAWYSDNTSNTPLDSETLIENGKVYYAGNSDGTCSGYREPVTAILEDFPSAGSGTHLEFVSNSEPVDLVTLISETPRGPVDTYGKMIPELKSGSTFFDPSLEANWTGEKRLRHYVESKNDYCEDDETFVWINIIPQEYSSHRLVYLGSTEAEASENMLSNFPLSSSEEGTLANIWLDAPLTVGETYIINVEGEERYYFVNNVYQAPEMNPEFTLTSDTNISQITLEVAQCPEVDANTQYFGVNSTLGRPVVADLTATDKGGGIAWYTDNTATQPLNPDVVLEDGKTYYADTPISSCRGSRAAVQVVFKETNSLLINDGLVGYWDLDNNAIDLSSNQNDGTLINTQPTTNRFNENDKALNFDGSSLIEFEDVLDVRLSDFSISAWFKIDPSNEGIYAIVSKSIGNGSEGRYAIGIDGNRIRVLLDYGPEIDFKANSVISDKKWHHLVVTWDRDGFVKIFLDGSIDGSKDISPAKDYNFDSPFTFKIGGYNNMFRFLGGIDDVGFYDRLLTPEEIQLMSSDRLNDLQAVTENGNSTDVRLKLNGGFEIKNENLLLNGGGYSNKSPLVINADNGDAISLKDSDLSFSDEYGLEFKMKSSENGAVSIENSSESTTNLLINNENGEAGISLSTGPDNSYSHFHISYNLDAVTLQAGREDENFNKLFQIEYGSEQAYSVMQITPSLETFLSGDVNIGQEDSELYDLTVQGDILAEGMRMDLVENWPDYVFSANYELITIDELKRLIAAQGKLPGIPSEEEIRRTGINLTEINRLLLEKIEELSLYIIKQKKELSGLRKDQQELIKEAKYFLRISK